MLHRLLEWSSLVEQFLKSIVLVILTTYEKSKIITRRGTAVFYLSISTCSPLNIRFYGIISNYLSLISLFLVYNYWVKAVSRSDATKVADRARMNQSMKSSTWIELRWPIGSLHRPSLFYIYHSYV